MLFADGAAFMASDKKIKKVNKIIYNEIKRVSQWLTTNKLTLNKKKTKFMIFCNKREGKMVKIIKKFKININNYCIEQVHEFKYLGVVFNSKLDWHSHLEYLSTKIAKGSGVIRRLKYDLPIKVLKLIYHSLVESHLRFGIISWGTAKSAALKTLTSIQNRLIKSLCPSTFSLDQAYAHLRR